MVIDDLNSTVSGCPTAVILAVHFVFAIGTGAFIRSSVGIECTVFAVIIAISESMDGGRDIIYPPVDKIEMMTGFVNRQTAGFFTHTVPAVEITGTVFGVDVPGEVNCSHFADFAFNDHFSD